MKKYLLIFFLTLMLSPSLVFASWWNPFSWKIWNFLTKKNVVVERTVIPLDTQNNLISDGKFSDAEVKAYSKDDKILELKKQINHLKTKSQLETNKIIKNQVDAEPVAQNKTDLCAEIDGIQELVPLGYVKTIDGHCQLASSLYEKNNSEYVSLQQQISDLQNSVNSLNLSSSNSSQMSTDTTPPVVIDVKVPKINNTSRCIAATIKFSEPVKIYDLYFFTNYADPALDEFHPSSLKDSVKSISGGADGIEAELLSGYFDNDVIKYSISEFSSYKNEHTFYPREIGLPSNYFWWVGVRAVDKAGNQVYTYIPTEFWYTDLNSNILACPSHYEW